MTADVTVLLDRIKELDIFESDPLYFVGGTALAYYLGHRISEDIDIIGSAPLPHQQITNAAKLKLIALLNRKKSRDLFDFKVILEKGILSGGQVLEIASRTINGVDSTADLFEFVATMQMAENDEMVYLDEKDPRPLNWEKIRCEVLTLLSSEGK